MEAARIIKKIASYLMVVIGGTIFIYASVMLATAFYINPGDNPTAYYSEHIYRQIMYCVIALAVMFVAQFALIGTPTRNEHYVYSLTLMVFFGVGLAVMLFTLIKGLVAIPNSKVNTDISFLLYSSIPAAGICLGEVIYGVIYFIAYKKEKKEDDEKKAKEEKEQVPGVNLTKEE